MNILVTGANGFIGKNLVEKLQSKDRIKLLSFTKENSYVDLEQLIIKSDFIFHLAGEVRPNSSIDDFISSNITLTENIINLLNKQGKIVPILLASTIHAKLLKNEYGKTKRESEFLVEKYAEERNINCFIFRLPHVFGERCKPNYNSVISTWIFNSLHNLDIKVFDRDIKMDYVYVQDIVSEFIDILSTTSNSIYYEPEKVYKTTLGEVVDFINEFKEHINDKDYTVNDNEFKHKLFNTYKDYAIQGN